MSRSSYSDDYGDDFPGQLELYRANVERSIRSKKGQARLRELKAALEAMPVKALVAGSFIRPSGEACALGVWAQRHAPGVTIREDEGDNETADALAAFHWPRLVVMDLIYMNDSIETGWVHEDYLSPHQDAEKYRGWGFPVRWPIRRARQMTDEERYDRVLAWVNKQIEGRKP